MSGRKPSSLLRCRIPLLTHLPPSGKKTLDDRCGSHYYVGCALAKNQLRVVTYLSPQSFDCEKDLIKERALAASV